MSSLLANVDFLILAGGLGTRLGSPIPKVMAPIGVDGEALLSIQLDRLKKFGAQRVILALGHQAEAVVRFITEARANNMMRMFRDEIVFSLEPHPLGTAGALRHALPLIRDVAFVMNGDTLVDVDLRDFVVDAVGADASVLHTWDDISTGICIFTQRALDTVWITPGPSLENDVLPKMNWSKVARDCTFLDIGTPEQLALAPTFLKEMKT